MTMYKVHKENCSCPSCKLKRKESHKPNCQCASCKSKRGERLKRTEHKPDCQCCVCRGKRGERIGELKSKECKQKIKEAKLKLWQDPEYRNRRSKETKELWLLPEFIVKQMKARHVKPNKAEEFLTILFQKLLPNQWKYTGDGLDKSVIIAGKVPDFMNIAGQKKIIELFGEPFHEPEEEQQRIDLFKQCGYQTLIVWYRELENMEKLIEKVTKFNEIES